MNNAAIDTTAPSDIDQDPCRKQRILNSMLVYSIAFGVIDAFLPEYGPELRFAFRLPLIALTVSWCHIDADQRNFSFGKVLRLLLIFFFIVGLPVYLLRTRGLRGVLSTILAFAFAMFVLLIEDAATLVALEIGRLGGLWEYELP